MIGSEMEVAQTVSWVMHLDIGDGIIGFHWVGV